MSRHFMSSTKTIFVSGISLFLFTFIASAKHPAHQSDATPFKVIGGFQLNPDALEENNPGLSPNRYGTTTLLQQAKDDEESQGPLLDPISKKEIVIRDQHYQLIDFKNQPLSKWMTEPRKSLGYGIRFIPAVPGFKSTESARSGRILIKGSETVDKYLREVVYGYKKPSRRGLSEEEIKAEQPIFAQIAYLHPEGFQGQPFSLSDSVNLKTEMGFTHKGLYIGDGKTVNSPPGYHGDTWWDEDQANYPAFMSVLDFSGFSDGENFNVKEFNKNGIMTALILNETNKKSVDNIFPTETDYKFDPLYSSSLEKVLDFYARWLKADPTDPIFDKDSPEAKFFKTYCAEHATDITNILLNLPQNLTGYKEVYGDEDGEELFELAVDKLYKRNGLRSGADAEYIRDAYLGKKEEERRQQIGQGLTPYWKLLEKDLPEDQKTKQVVKLDEATGRYVATNPKFTKVGYSLAWQPETVADLLKDFIQAYLPWPRVGSITSVAAILGFSGEAKKRMNIDVPQYVKTITPIVQEIFLYEAAMEIGLTKLSGQSNENVIYERFAAARAARTQALENIMNSIAVKMQSFEREEAQIDAKTANQIKLASKGFTKLIDGSGGIENDKGWKAAKDIDEKSREGQSFAGPAGLLRYRDHIYDDHFSPKIKGMLVALNDINPNPTEELTVKYYYAPAVHVRVAMGIHDASPEARKNVRLYPVGHVIQASETKPIEGQHSAVVNDDLSIDLKVL